MKRNILKKTAAYTLALTLATGSLPANTPLQDLFSGSVITAHAEVTASGFCGADTNEGGAESVAWSLEDGVLTISGEGEMADYDDVPPWYSSRSDITEAVIESGVTSIGNRAFMNCSSITSVTIPDSVTSIGNNAFSRCTSLTSITIPDSVTSIESLAFNSCHKLISVVMERETPPDIGDYIFLNTSEDLTIRVPANAVDNYQTDEKWSAYKEHIVSMNTVDHGYCGASTNEGGETSVSWTLNTDGVLTISGEGEMADYDYDDLPPWDNDRSGITEAVIESGVTSIGGYAFCECISLTEITIPNSVTSIGNWAFEWCSSLTEITIPDSVSRIGKRAFESSYSLTEITIPDGVTSIGGDAFSNCTNLTEITIPNSVTSIGDGAFWHCTSLTEITIPDSVTSIGEGAFYECISLTEITIPNSVTSIGEGAFSSCTNLTEITIPNSVTSIGGYAFDECISLKSVIIERAETLTALGSNAFVYYDYKTGSTAILPNVTIYVPATVVADYKNAENWSDYADRIIGYSDTQLPDGKYKQTAEKDGTYYTRFVFVVPKTDFAGKSKALFTATYNGADYTYDTNTYYTGVISNGITYNPASAEDRAMFVVTVSSGSDISADLKCKLDFE